MNSKLVRLLGANQTVYPHQLDMCYPRIIDKVVELWGTPAMEKYFKELLLDQRGNRQGFPPSVMSEIFALSNYYGALKPARPRSIENWADVAEIDRLDRHDRK